MSGRVALATCAELPDLDSDDRPLVGALARRGVVATPAVWDDPRVDWSTFDLVVLRSTWDYAERHRDFLEWARTLERVLNPVPALEWNVDKRYLEALAAAGVPIVETHFVDPDEALAMSAGSWVVKPSISAGGRSSAWFAPGDAGATALMQRIHAEGRTAMVQPYLADAEEKALVYVNGRFSHALRRQVPLPAGEDRAVFFLDEQLQQAEATPRERETGEAALACVHGELLYARIDLLGGLVLEVEVIEPSLYLAFGDGAVERFAEAIASELS